MTEKSWMELGRELEAEVARLKAAGVGRNERAERTAGLRSEWLGARSAAFAGATQGRGKPLSKMSHGDGKRVEEK
jgi:hypothetical protein